MATIRPMLGDDEALAEDAWTIAFGAMRSAHHLPVLSRTPASIAEGQRRVRHLRTTDPGGSWVAEEDGRIVGMAQAHRRGDLWVLATLGVLPAVQERGIGRSLLEHALDYGDRRSPGLIFSSPDPRALHRYTEAGFALHPALTAYGPLPVPPTTEDALRVGNPDDMPLLERIDLTVRGATRTQDLLHLLDLGRQVVIGGEDAYAIVYEGRISMLAAPNEAAATKLLRTVLARCSSGDHVDIGWITAEDQWAIQLLSQARIPLHGHGAVMIRGEWRPNGVYLPNGVFG
jgi:GNAT superfamily N-acetyltransferase